MTQLMANRDTDTKIWYIRQLE